MHKNSVLFLSLLSIYNVNAEIDYFKHKESIDAIPTIEAYKRIIDQSQKTTPPSSTAKKQSVEKNLLLAEKARLRADTKQAIIHYKKILELEPSHFDACFNVGNMYYNKEKFKKSLFYYEEGLKSKRKAPQFFHNMGLCLKQLKRFDDAIEAFSNAIDLKPDYVKAYYQLGKVLQKKCAHERAASVFLEILKQNPYDALAHRLLGKSYKQLDQSEKALEHIRTAYSLRPKDINNMLELANTLTMHGNFDEALGLYQKIRILHPKVTSALYNIAYVLKRQGYLHKAVDILKTIIENEPKHTQAHLSLGLCHLSLGNFDEGWKEYEWRWEKTEGRIPKLYSKPVWDGSDLNGKSILIIAEQGLGDTFQFIRYAQICKNMGAYVIFKSRPEQIEILSLCPYIDKIVTSSDKLPNFDIHIPLLSIPLVLKTVEETIPAEIPYLKADPQLVKHWKNRLATDTNFKIGICWQGNANYSTQFLRATVAAKSMNVKFFEPLAKITGVSLYSLQKIFGTEQLESLDNTIKIHDFGPNFDTINGRFMDTAAVIKNLDLIITVDTSVSHLAAALGAPTWIILPEPADWRWMTHRNDTPWYPNVRLFRQQQRGDWTNLMHNIVQAVLNLVNSSASLTPHNIIPEEESTLEGIADLEKQNYKTPKTRNINDHDEISTLSVDEFIDKMTLSALSGENESDSIDTFIKCYKHYLEKWPNLKEHVQHLLHVNKYLINLQKQVKESEDILDSSFSETARQISRATKYKDEIKNIIKQTCL